MDGAHPICTWDTSLLWTDDDAIHVHNFEPHLNSASWHTDWKNPNFLFTVKINALRQPLPKDTEYCGYNAFSIEQKSILKAEKNSPSQPINIPYEIMSMAKEMIALISKLFPIYKKPNIFLTII